jgi:hypothetical protein
MTTTPNLRISARAAPSREPHHARHEPKAPAVTRTNLCRPAQCGPLHLHSRAAIPPIDPLPSPATFGADAPGRAIVRPQRTLSP